MNIKKRIVEGFFFLVSYLPYYLLPKIKEEFKKSKEQLLKNVWNSIKEDIRKYVKEAVNHVQEYLQTAEYETREREVMDVLFKRVQLPFIFRPFKGIIKKVFRNKIRNLIAENLKKLDLKI